MFKSRFQAFKKELQSFSASERLFVLFVMLTSFCICGEYALVRPVSNSIFIHAYGAKALPYAWMITIPVNFALVALYNALLSRFNCFKILFGTVVCIIAGNVLGGFFLKSNFYFPFLFYIWKDIYILLLFQQLWSVIHSTIASSRAKYLYGFIFAVGASGSIVGSMVPGFLAVKVGSESLLLYSLPFCIGLIIFYGQALKNSAISSLSAPSKASGILEGVRQIKGSKVLMLILLIVIFMQFASTLLDYQFNITLENTIFQKDLRTEFTGRIFGFVHLFSFLMQLGGSFVIVSLLGLRRSHFFVPLLLGCNALCSLALPVFGLITLSFMTIKSIDFSLYHIIKEMLYIPLKREEKFHAKSVIDVFAYRSSKALASVSILIIQWLAIAQLVRFVSLLLIGIFILWIIALFSIYKTSEALHQPS